MDRPSRGRIHATRRNGLGSTAIAPYGIRARANAPVSTPIAWEELDNDVRLDYFNVKNIPARLDRMKVDGTSSPEALKTALNDRVDTWQKTIARYETEPRERPVRKGINLNPPYGEGRQELAAACFAFLPARARLDLAGWGAEDIFAHS